MNRQFKVGEHLVAKSCPRCGDMYTGNPHGGCGPCLAQIDKKKVNERDVLLTKTNPK